jgi:hypothetical protein
MIGVCIKYFHENYGGMLQAYATASMLEERGLEYELIRYEKQRTIPGIIRSLPRLLNRVLLNDKYEAFLKKQGMRAHPEFAEMDAARMKCFHAFRDAHFTRLSPVFKGYPALCEGARRYSAVVTGSDQLWSPAGLPTNYYNLMFVPREIRKISYASSFGVGYIPWYQKKRTAAYLNRIEFISMRENKGSQLVKELTGREVPTILDPVFMFDKAGWEKLIPTETVVDEPYILAYFLGENPAHREAVTQAARELGVKIVALPHMDQYVAADEQFGDYRLYEVGPDRFLNLIRGAAYVCTDSFHGSCFALIHGKSFVTFSRYEENSGHSKNSRIDTLCANLGLQGRRFRSAGELATQLRDPIDENAVAQRLAKLKKETDDYLEDAFKGVQ